MDGTSDGAEKGRTMRYWLGQTLREARQARGIKLIDIARLADYSDASALTRFENDETWPNRLDLVIAAYAYMCGIEDGRELWESALKRWRRSGSAPTLGELTPAQRAVLLALEAARRQSPYDGGSRSEPTATPKKGRAR